MKLLNLLLSLAFTSYVYSENAINFNHGNGLYLMSNTADFFSQLSKECQEELEKDNLYLDCIKSDDINMSNYETMCKLANTKKCKDYYKDPLNVVPKCANDERFKLEMNLFKNVDPTKNFMCLRSAEGKLCPLAEATLNNKSVTEEILSATCESKACTQSLIELFEHSIEIAETNEKIYQENVSAETTKATLEEYIKKMKSEECTSKAKDDLATTKYIGADVKDDDIKSGAVTIKVSSVLITILSLLYYLL